jgi:uncharacterized protein YhdP
VEGLARGFSKGFADLQEGFSYDLMESNLLFMDADLYAQDFVLDGPSARITAVGRVGLKARDVDQLVSVFPKVGGTLPLIGALIGGPTVGAAVFLVDKLLKEPSGKLSDAMQIRYRVSGQWDALDVVALDEGESPVGGVD